MTNKELQEKLKLLPLETSIHFKIEWVADDPFYSDTIDDSLEGVEYDSTDDVIFLKRHEDD